MVLSRSKQEIQEERSILGIEFRKTIRYLLDLSKGRVPTKAGEWFYGLFLGQRQAPTTTEEVKELLSAAWWVEESDLRQELLFRVWRHKLTSRSDLKYTLARNIRDWLIQQRVFSRQNGWEVSYQGQLQEYYELERSVGLPMLFQHNPIDTCPFSLFNRYLMYLSYILKLPRTDIERVLLSQGRQVNRFQAVLREQMEDYHGTC